MTTLGRRPDQGSVPVLEEFYGLRLGPELLAFVRGTPLDQLLELADRVQDQHRRLQGALRRRHYRSWGDGMETPGILSNLPPALATRDLIVHDDLYFDGRSSVSVVDRPEFKRLFLFSESLVVPDPLFSWAHDLLISDEIVDIGYPMPTEESVQSSLAADVEYLIRLRPLLDSNGIVLMPDAESHVPDVFEDLGGMGVPTLSRGFLQEMASNKLWEDPYLASVVADMAYMPRWEREYLALTSPRLAQEAAERLVLEGRLDGQFASVWNRAHPEDPLLSGHDWLSGTQSRALGLAILNRGSGLSPSTSSPTSVQHLLKSSRVALDGVGTVRTMKRDLQAGLSLGIPDLSSVTIEDLIILRSSEDTFQRTRAALLDLAAAVEEGGATSYSSLQDLVVEAAADIVGPTFDEMSRRIQANSILSNIIGAGAGAAVRMGLTGVASILPPLEGLAAVGASAPAANAAQRQATKVARKRREPERVAVSVLRSTLPSDRAHQIIPPPRHSLR